MRPPGNSAVRQAQAARDWGLAARILADHWPRLYLDGQNATVHALLARFPAGAPAADAELSVSTSTVKTHLRNLYAKLGAHRRAEAVRQARVLGLLAPSARVTSGRGG